MTKATKETASQIVSSLKDLGTLEGLNYKERRELEKTLRRFVKKNNLGTDLLKTKEEVTDFVINVFDGESTSSEDGVKVSVRFLREERQDKSLNTQPRSYQREKVASLEWKCEIIKTILIDKQFKIPPIHIRIIRDDNRNIIGFEVADGQQRVTAILDFMDGDFKLPDSESFGKFKNMYYSDILHHHNVDAEAMKNYGLSTVFYDNFSDEDIARLFIKILNNTKDLNVQEKNNATRSRLADFVRYTSRNGNGEWKDTQEMFHDFFNRTTTAENTPKQSTEWDYFNGMGMGRMEGDLWLASLIYLYLSGWRSGVTPKRIEKFYQETSQQAGHGLGWNFKDKVSTSSFPKLEKEILNLLNIGQKFGNWVKTNKDKSYLKPNFLLFTLLFINEYMNKFNVGKSVDWDKFSEKMIETYDKWNKPTVYEKDEKDDVRYQSNKKTPLGPFKALWGAFNANVIKTAMTIVEYEMNLDPDWGFIEIDKCASFSKSDIEKRWNEVGRVCEYTGVPLRLEEVVGDHATPRSWGIKMGGVTEYHNLRVTNEYHNRRKLQMNEEAYRAKLEQEKKAA